MSDCIQCANCGAVSFYEGGKTKIHCITCYNALRAENEKLKEALMGIYQLPNDSNIQYAVELVTIMQDRAQQALTEATK